MGEYAYARVSARDQNLARQLEQFNTRGIPPKNVFSDKMSGKDFDRIGYKRLLKKLKKHDLLVIKSIDRLGRNYSAIIAEWNYIISVIGADILVLDMPLLDTRTKAESLVGKFISDIVLQVLSFVAENERQNIKSRQSEGIALAKLKGVRFGRPCTIYTDKFIKLAKSFKQKSVSLKNALNISKMSRSNFYYHMSRCLAL